MNNNRCGSAVEYRTLAKHSHLSYDGVTLTLSVWSNNNNVKTVEFGMNTNSYSILPLIIIIKPRIITVTYSLSIGNKDRKLAPFIRTGIE